MKKNHSKFIILSIIAFFSITIANAQYDGGVYWTYEDYVNNKLDVKGGVKTYIKAMATWIIVFEKENGEKEKVNITKAFAVKDHRGFLWKPHGPNLLILMAKGKICFYIDVEEIGRISDGIECNKRGKPAVLGGARFYVASGINGEIKKGNGTKNLKVLVADNQAATEVLRNTLAFELAFDASVIYNRNAPQEGDYVYPDCVK